MDITTAITAVPGLGAVQAELQIVETVCGYAAQKTPLPEALQEVKIMSGDTAATIKAACKNAMDVIGEHFEAVMTSFNDETGANVDAISLEPFKARFDDEINKEHAGLKAISARVVEMSSGLAVALNIPLPAATPASVAPTKPVVKKSIFSALKSLAFEETVSPATAGAGLVTPPGWLTEAILHEDAAEVQKLILLNNKYNQTKSADALRAFASKFKMNDTDLADLILTVLDEARKQIVLSDAIIANVTASYQKTEKIVTVLLAMRDQIIIANNYVDGKIK